MPDTNIRGLACDHASLEIHVDGQPIPEGFTTIDIEVAREFEKLWLNGRSTPSQRSQGKVDVTGSAEMPIAQFYSMVNDRLGGQGDDPDEPAWMFVEFPMFLAFRPKNSLYTYQINCNNTTIKKAALSSAQGKAAMMKLDLDMMGCEFPPPQ